MILRVSSFFVNTRITLFLSDTLSKDAVIPMRSPRSELALTLVVSCAENAFIDLTAYSILRVTVLSNAVRMAF